MGLPCVRSAECYCRILYGLGFKVNKAIPLKHQSLPTQLCKYKLLDRLALDFFVMTSKYIACSNLPYHLESLTESRINLWEHLGGRSGCEYALDSVLEIVGIEDGWLPAKLCLKLSSRTKS